MIAIDIEMPDNCYECPLMMRCDECEGYNNECPLDDQIDCGYVVRRGTVVIEDRSNLTLWDRPERCPLKAMPPIDPVKRGRWKREVLGSTSGYGTTVMYQCSECERMAISKYHYCPNCGAKMDGEEDE